MSDAETPKVVVHEIDHVAEQRARLKAAEDATKASVRAGHVVGLENELAYLERQPVPNTRRIADVKVELDRYSSKPAERRLETATPIAQPVTTTAPAPVVPAKKAAVPPAKKAPAKRAPAKKAAAKKAPAKKA